VFDLTKIKCGTYYTVLPIKKFLPGIFLLPKIVQD